ncbi:hypothetical protein PR048_006153 [Dryococelus australis]|uniref:Reverse transcriptase n=1 Tax=Dryococelus australis TaxID=614101 RepID=A0ABQ9IA61_9NEOP|nr:hypothetical protein PR048_006153 [Dryococelus australis]
MHLTDAQALQQPLCANKSAVEEYHAAAFTFFATARNNHLLQWKSAPEIFQSHISRYMDTRDISTMLPVASKFTSDVRKQDCHGLLGRVSMVARWCGFKINSFVLLVSPEKMRIPSVSKPYCYELQLAPCCCPALWGVTHLDPPLPPDRHAHYLVSPLLLWSPWMIDSGGQAVAPHGSWLASRSLHPSEEANRRRKNILEIRTLGATRELAKFLDDDLPLYKYRHGPVASSLWRNHLAECRRERVALHCFKSLVNYRAFAGALWRSAVHLAGGRAVTNRMYSLLSNGFSTRLEVLNRYFQTHLVTRITDFRLVISHDTKHFGSQLTECAAFAGYCTVTDDITIDSVPRVLAHSSWRVVTPQGLGRRLDQSPPRVRFTRVHVGILENRRRSWRGLCGLFGQVLRPLRYYGGGRMSQNTPRTFEATVAERLVRSPPTTGFNTRPGHQIFASGNRAGRCCWSAGFLGRLLFLPPLHSGAAPNSLQSPTSALKTLLLRAAQLSSLTSLTTHLQRTETALNGGETRDPRDNPPTSGIVRHDSHKRKSGSDPTGNRSLDQTLITILGSHAKPYYTNFRINHNPSDFNIAESNGLEKKREGKGEVNRGKNNNGRSHVTDTRAASGRTSCACAVRALPTPVGSRLWRFQGRRAIEGAEGLWERYLCICILPTLRVATGALGPNNARGRATTMMRGAWKGDSVLARQKEGEWVMNGHQRRVCVDHWNKWRWRAHGQRVTSSGERRWKLTRWTVEERDAMRE